MRKLYLITGPAGVGKSTVSKAIAESLEKSVLLEGDEVYHHVVGSYISPWKEGNHLEVFWKVCINIIKTYLDSGYDVVFNYIIMPEKLSLLQNAFEGIDTKFIVLLVDEETILARDKERRKDWQMGPRCLELLQDFKEVEYPKQYILDTSKLSVEETVKEILKQDQFQLKK